MKTFDANSLGASFERSADANPNSQKSPAPKANYADLNAAGLQPGEHYTCAWGPNDTVKPSLIRIIVTLADPAGRLPDGQTFEFVINLP
jgi:hypothetical protein